MKYLLLILAMCGAAFAQNTDKSATALTAREMQYNIYEATTEAFRVVVTNSAAAGNATAGNQTTIIAQLDTIQSTLWLDGAVTTWDIDSDTVTTTAEQLSDVDTPRGFWVENADPSDTVWVNFETFTTGGIPIYPGGQRLFKLGNPNLCWVRGSSSETLYFVIRLKR